ncbi:hypothetical protein CI109_107073 [Kwoniella shandongensis]|uniref:Uncharacterized protein n=1 Tax=Kwoniella shandongensis TaxID=1734106 RepID=A0A5M6BT71_9TREE|nr:uncharacterized protein CI109_006481 [Kwoniella shandongensis]KAA5525212.1 hypothetical protein CI109_006481 [Kwoniella shandongensis]
MAWRSSHLIPNGLSSSFVKGLSGRGLQGELELAWPSLQGILDVCFAHKRRMSHWVEISVIHQEMEPPTREIQWREKLGYERNQWQDEASGEFSNAGSSSRPSVHGSRGSGQQSYGRPRGE